MPGPQILHNKSFWIKTSNLHKHGERCDASWFPVTFFPCCSPLWNACPIIPGSVVFPARPNCIAEIRVLSRWLFVCLRWRRSQHEGAENLGTDTVRADEAFQGRRAETDHSSQPKIGGPDSLYETNVPPSLPSAADTQDLHGHLFPLTSGTNSDTKDWPLFYMSSMWQLRKIWDVKIRSMQMNLSAKQK